MLRKSFLLGVLATMTVAIGAGCYVYYPEDDASGGGFAGWDCQVDRDCAAGCYCSDAGYCEEAGFCETPEECPEGFTCDDRNSCVPDRNQGCATDAECDIGSYCNADGVCEETGICTDDVDDCQEGQTCDLDRNTCVPADPVSECQAEATCGLEPACDPGTSAEIVDGCYTGICIANEECSDGAPCSQLPDAESCDARMDCNKVVNGINCTNGAGDPCDVGDTDCSCESVEFAECRDAAPPPNNDPAP